MDTAISDDLEEDDEPATAPAPTNEPANSVNSSAPPGPEMAIGDESAPDPMAGTDVTGAPANGSPSAASAPSPAANSPGSPANSPSPAGPTPGAGGKPPLRKKIFGEDIARDGLDHYTNLGRLLDRLQNPNAAPESDGTASAPSAGSGSTRTGSQYLFDGLGPVPAPADDLPEVEDEAGDASPPEDEFGAAGTDDQSESAPASLEHSLRDEKGDQTAEVTERRGHYLGDETGDHTTEFTERPGHYIGDETGDHTGDYPPQPVAPHPAPSAKDSFAPSPKAPVGPPKFAVFGNTDANRDCTAVATRQVIADVSGKDPGNLYHPTPGFPGATATVDGVREAFEAHGLQPVEIRYDTAKDLLPKIGTAPVIVAGMWVIGTPQDGHSVTIRKDTEGPGYTVTNMLGAGDVVRVTREEILQNRLPLSNKLTPPPGVPAYFSIIGGTGAITAVPKGMSRELLKKAGPPYNFPP